MNEKLKKVIIISSLAFGLFVIILVIIFSLNDTNKEAPKVTQYTDPGTGETVIDISTKTPEDTNGHTITMLGFDKLITDYGMTLEQIKSLETKFQAYSIVNDSFIKEISVSLSTIETTVDSKTGNASLKFKALINREKSVIAKISYFGIGDPLLVIYDLSNKQIFKSGQDSKY